MERTTVKLAKLVAGPNPRSDINRVPIDDLMASIPVRGVLMPLIVSPTEKGRFAVRSGGRRLRALLKLYKDQAKTYDVPVIVIGEEEAPDELALIDNVQRVNLHPVDEYHQYSELVDKGLSQPEVAQRFGVSEKWVGQRLQLAKLSPELLKEWRAGRINADQAAALSSNPSHDVQNATYERAKRDPWSMRPEHLRQQVHVKAIRQDSPLFIFVGAEIYEAAGGTYSADLFTEDRLILAPALLEELGEAKLQAQCRALESDGWKWAKTDAELGGKSWHWPNADITPWATPDEQLVLSDGEYQEKAATVRAVVERIIDTPEARAQGGCIVTYDTYGQFDVRCFMADEMRRHDDGEEPYDDGDGPGDYPPEPTTRPAASTPPIDPTETPVKVNFKLREDLAEILSLAVSEALSNNPRAAYAALMATLAQQVVGGMGSRSPIAIKADPWGPNAPDVSRDAMGWEATFALQMTSDGYDLAHLVSACVDLRQPQFDPKQWTEIGRKRMVQSLCKALDPEELRRAIEERFDRSAYFARIPSSRIQAILAAELGYSGGIPAPKSALVALAARMAADQGWLPPDLAYALPSGDSDAG